MMKQHAWIAIGVDTPEPEPYYEGEPEPEPFVIGTIQIMLTADDREGLVEQARERVAALGGAVPDLRPEDTEYNSETPVVALDSGEVTALTLYVFPCSSNGHNLDRGGY